MKKKLLSITVAAMALVVSATPVFAHGSHHRKAKSKTVSYAVCTVQDCVSVGVHAHSGKNYISHYYGDGHKYHDYCDIVDCVLTGYHAHDDEYYFGHTLNDGHGYHHANGHY